MASHVPGYEEERFVTAVSQNFICSICFNVLRDPVLCRRNQHCFCRGCITSHLKNSQRCPTCADPLSLETLTAPQRMVKEYLNELKIRCVYHDRGCQEILQLQDIEQHENSCGFALAICTNRGCDVTVNKRDFIRHENEVCDLRKLKCHSCEEITKTLANVDKRVENVEKNMPTNLTVKREMAVLKRNVALNKATIEKNMANLERSVGNIERNVKTNVANLETNVANLETNMRRDIADIKTHLDGKLKAISDEVVGVKTALIEVFDQMKDILVKVEGKVEEQPRKKRRAESDNGKNIIVAGGLGNDSVEMFNWRQRTWSPLQSLPQKRSGATSFVCNNHVTIVGGYCIDTGYVDDMIRMNIEPYSNLSTHWSVCRAKLPAKMAYHSSVLHNSNLMVSGGLDENAISDKIRKVEVVPSYNVKTLSRMPEPRHRHCTEIFDDSLLIVGGGTTTDRYEDNLKSVVLYDIKNNVCKQLAPLPYEVSDMATVRWGDNVVVIGGADKHGEELNTVIMYNVTTEQSHMLPPMRCKRRGCSAVVVGNNIVVLGGKDEQSKLKSVEAFNFQLYTWQELPQMSQARYFHTAVVV